MNTTSIESVIDSADFRQLLGLFQKDSRICYLPNFAILMHNRRKNYIYMPNSNLVEPVLGKWNPIWYTKERYVLGVVEKDAYDNVYFWIYAYYDTRDFHGYKEAEFQTIWKKLYEPDMILTPMTFAVHEEYGIPNYMLRETYRRRQKPALEVDTQARIRNYETTKREKERETPYTRDSRDARDSYTRDARDSYTRDARDSYTRDARDIRDVRAERRDSYTRESRDSYTRESIDNSSKSTKVDTNVGTSISHELDGITKKMTQAAISKTEPTSSYYVRKTEQPDVYNVYDTNKVCLGHASIPSMKLSRDMATYFENYTIHQYVPIYIEVKTGANGVTKYIPKLQ